MLRWFVRLDPVGMKVKNYPYGVWKGGFRDSVHESKWLAEQRCKDLNEEDEKEEINQ